MDNRKDAKTGSGWLAETRSGFRREPEFGKLAGSQKSAGFRATGPTGAPVQVWRRFIGNKFPDPLSPHHTCAFFRLEFLERVSVF